MINRLFKRLAVVLVLVVLSFSFCIAYAKEPKQSVESETAIYVDYGNGFELLAELDFEKYVTEQSIVVDKPITALRVVRGECYDLNLDRVTLNGVAPVGFERKLSDTDNDLLEVTDSIDFVMSGKGELVISARAPKDVMGEKYSIKFPKHNIGKFDLESIYYNYELGTNYGSFSEDDLVIPTNDYLFATEMCYPDSGHPDAPIDFYVANDEEMLYVFFEAFVDNTLDNGKDFAAVHIKDGDTVKSYKVYTTEENEYGRWWFDYTDSSEEYDWQHMSYLVKIPMFEIETENSNLEIAFEYYGTVSAQELLERLGVGEVYYISQDMYERDINSYSPYYTDECVRILPAPGMTNNADSGDTEEGEWWITNVGTEQKPEYILYLNGVNFTKTRKYWREAIIAPYGSITICLVDGTTNTINTTSDANASYGIDGQASCDVNIVGNGILNINADTYAFVGYGNLTIADGAIVNANSNNSIYEDAVYCYENLTIDNATFRVNHKRVKTQYEEEQNYEVKSFAIVCYGEMALENNAVLEVTASNADYNYALGLVSLDSLSYDSEIATIKEGDNADNAEVVDELTAINTNPSYRLGFGSKPYVIIEQLNTTNYTVTFNSDGGSKVASQTVASGDKATKPKDPTKSRYTFKEWQLSGETFDFDTPITEDIELKAVWNQKQTSSSSGGGSSTPSNYKVTTKIENGTITPENPRVKRKNNQEFTFKANDGYEITDVLVDGKSVGIIDSYELENVTRKHTIEVKTSKLPTLENVDEWALTEMAKAEEKGLIPETFAKKDATKAISRLDFAAVAVKLYEAISGNKAKPAANNPFDDTDDEYVLKAYALGITKGTAETIFSPNDEITREQMATMLTRALEKAGINTTVDLEKISKFADDGEMHDWGKASIYYMSSIEIIKGVGDNTFNVLGNATIEQALLISERSAEKFAK